MPLVPGHENQITGLQLEVLLLASLNLLPVEHYWLRLSATHLDPGLRRLVCDSLCNPYRVQCRHPVGEQYAVRNLDFATDHHKLLCPCPPTLPSRRLLCSRSEEHTSELQSLTNLVCR